MNENIDDLILHGILMPWRESCTDSPQPWEATHELRKEWLAMMTSDSKVISYTGAFALSRAAALSIDERTAIEKYFSAHDGGLLKHETVVHSMLSGATLAHVYVQACLNFGFRNVDEETSPWLVFLAAKYLRHPDSLWKKDAIGEFAPALQFACAANPCTPFAPDHTDQWGTALSLFKGAPFSPAIHTGDFLRFAHMLRVDLDESSLRFALEISALPSPYSAVVESNPVLLVGPCPHYNPANPSKEAIKYFSDSNNPVISIWKSFNPLLVNPWEAHNDRADPGILAGLSIFGGFPLPEIPEIALSYPDLASRLATHPLMPERPKVE